MIFVIGSWLPRSVGAPQVGQKAPDFTLTDSNNKPVTLAQLLIEPIDNKPPKAVLLTGYAAHDNVNKSFSHALSSCSSIVEAS